MTVKKPQKMTAKKQKSQSFFKRIFSQKIFWALAFIVGCFYLYIFIYALGREQAIVPLTILALVSGMFFQSYKVTADVDKIFTYLCFAALFSLYAFKPSDHDVYYNLGQHLQLWVYAFILSFLFIMSFQHEKELTTPLGEGTSLLLSMGLCYWLISKNLLNFSNVFSQVLTVLVILITTFATIHALFQIKHDRFSRFILSLSSCIAIFVLSVDHFFQLLNRNDFHIEQSSTENLMLLIQYFLLGISSLYLFQNFMLLLQYFPNRYSANYWADFKENTKRHIDRFSESQITLFEAMFCLFVSVVAYSLNHYFHLIPTNMSIWLVIFICPFILQTLNKIAQPIPLNAINFRPIQTQTYQKIRKSKKRKSRKNK